MKRYKHNIGVMIVIAIVAMAMSHIFTIGYGFGYQSRGKAMLAIQEAQSYTPSHLTIEYERNNNGKNDILRLEIDTIYRSIGKGAFRYETICDREISLHAINGEQFTNQDALLCFIDGSAYKWQRLNGYQKVQGYDCHRSIMQMHETTWMAWHTTQLPHCAQGAITTDGLQGLILQLNDSKGEYKLKAISIEEKQG